MTDMYAIKEHLGDVPASLLSLGKPDDVYKSCNKLIKDLGREGLMLSSGCCVPPDASLENVKAMISAAKDC